MTFPDDPTPVWPPGDGAALEDLLGHPRLVLRLGLRQVVVALQGGVEEKEKIEKEEKKEILDNEEKMERKG